MSVKIASVVPGSAAQRVGIQPGETLISINKNDIYDILDYRFYETEKRLRLVLQDISGKSREVEILKGEYQSIGLEFETYLMDQQHSCRNRCIFCFIDQLPKGLRKSLYFKDDDSRLSFLFVYYITLTNLSEHEVNRIIKMHISPINISVHTTNPELRVKMMGNRFAGESLKILYRFAEAGIQLNCQMVLCPGINDGAELERSLHDLLPLFPAVQSIALVPVGLTKYREGLYPLEPYTCDTARNVIEIAERYGQEMFEKHGNRVCYAADEFYLKAELPIPEAAFYGDFDQLENGVGLMANLKEEFLDAMEEMPEDFGKKPFRKVTLATGMAAAPFLNTLLDGLRQKCHNLSCNVIPIVNYFFGERINVAGLVTGGDLKKQLQGKDLGEELILPSVMLRHEGDLFLDDVSVKDLEKELNTPIRLVPEDGYALYRAVMGIEE